MWCTFVFFSFKKKDWVSQYQASCRCLLLCKGKPQTTTTTTSKPTALPIALAPHRHGRPIAGPRDAGVFAPTAPSLGRKQLELEVLQQRFEPPEPQVGAKPRPATGETQAVHVLRRYDEALCYFRGFSYNPHRAYFDRDAYGTGLLQFENGVSLLGTTAAQDRWRTDVPTPPPVRVSRGARIDAFLAMLERRQAMTELSGMAPTCVFVGEQLPVSVLQRPGRRSPPRPPGARIPVHRYRRLCVSMRSVTPEFGTIHCLVMAERTQRIDGELPLYVLCSGEAVTQQTQAATNWRIQVAQDVSQQWNALVRRTDYAVFDRPLLLKPRVQIKRDASWPMACPQGDAQMLFRLGLLLESPDLNYAPWVGGLAIGSLRRLLQLAPPATGTTSSSDPKPVAPRSTRQSPALVAVHPDVSGVSLLAVGPQRYAREQGLYRLYPRHRAHPYRSGAVPGQCAGYRGDPMGSAYRQKEEEEEEKTGGRCRTPPSGVAAGRGQWWKRRRKKRTGTEATARRSWPRRPLTRGVTLSPPRPVVQRDRGILQLITPPKMTQNLNAYDARFLALRRASEATNRIHPFYVISSMARATVLDGYRVARAWRHAVMRDPRVLWTLGIQALEFLYGPGGRKIWNQADTPAADGDFARAAWERQIERRAPRQGAPTYSTLAAEGAPIQAFADDRARAAGRTQLPALAGKAIDGDKVLLQVTRGVAPPDRGTNLVDFQILEASVVTSLAENGMLFLGPNTRLQAPDQTPRPRLEEQIEARLAVMWEQEVQGTGSSDGRQLADSTLRALGAMTLLSWEWGRWRGMVRFLSWVDAIGERVRAPGAQGLPISSRLLGRFKVLGGLALGALGRRTLVAEAPPPPSTPPVVVVPQLLPLPVTPPPRAATPPPAPVSPVVLADTGSADTLAFVEELYGYREGELRRKFGQAAQDWAQEGADSATDLLGIAEIRLQLKGLGPNPDPDRITRVFAGWSRASVAPVELARLEPRYDWHQSGGIAAPVPTVTANSGTPVPRLSPRLLAPTVCRCLIPSITQPPRPRTRWPGFLPKGRWVPVRPPSIPPCTCRV